MRPVTDIVRRWKPKYDELDDADDGFIEQGVRLSIREATSGKYERAVSRFIAYMERHNRAFTLDTFGRYLAACRRQGASASTISGMRCAVLWAQRAYNTDQWAADARLCRAIRGYRYEDKLARPPRGAVGRSMLAQLKARYPQFALAFYVAYYAVLRRKQLLNLRSGDAVFEGQRCILTVRADKRANAKNAKTTTSRKELVLPEAKELLRALQKTTPHGQLFFPKLDVAKLDAAVAETAITCQWPANLVFDGLHCLRHGGAHELRNYYDTIMASMGDPAAMAPTTAQWYSRLNALRVTACSEEAAALEEEEGEGEESI